MKMKRIFWFLLVLLSLIWLFSECGQKPAELHERILTVDTHVDTPVSRSNGFHITKLNDKSTFPWMFVIHNPETGEEMEKSGFFLNQIHAGEVIASMSCFCYFPKSRECIKTNCVKVMLIT